MEMRLKAKLLGAALAAGAALSMLASGPATAQAKGKE